MEMKILKFARANWERIHWQFNFKLPLERYTILDSPLFHLSSDVFWRGDVS